MPVLSVRLPACQIVSCLSIGRFVLRTYVLASIHILCHHAVVCSFLLSSIAVPTLSRYILFYFEVCVYASIAKNQLELHPRFPENMSQIIGQVIDCII